MGFLLNDWYDHITNKLNNGTGAIFELYSVQVKLLLPLKNSGTRQLNYEYLKRTGSLGSSVACLWLLSTSGNFAIQWLSYLLKVA